MFIKPNRSSLTFAVYGISLLYTNFRENIQVISGSDTHRIKKTHTFQAGANPSHDRPEGEKNHEKGSPGYQLCQNLSHRNIYLRHRLIK